MTDSSGSAPTEVARTDNNLALDTVEEAIEAIGRGELVVVVDDEDRENEGDLIMAANQAKPEKVAFMIRHTSGILCTPVVPEHARRLHLDPMVASNDAPLGTAFTVSVDYRHGLTTGISAEERCNTILGLTNSNASAEDFVRPGHVFPLVAKEGGVLMRSGHTEAAVDLARLAGLPPVGLLAEIVNDDGTVKRLPELVEFARTQELKIISIADMITYRRMREQLVTRVTEFDVATPAGPAHGIVYRTPYEDVEQLALVIGTIRRRGPVLVRIHREKLIEDVFGPQDGRAQNMLTASLEKIRAAGGGVLLYLRGASGVPVDTMEHSHEETHEETREAEWKEIGVGAQILRDLGVNHIRLLAGRNLNYIGLKGFGLELDGTEILE
ncbi:MAG: 3,4-dihydroxy-2-butanone-4-phosphate synthase [Gammaproteobacteria bacterium]|nr:3,4-dihydroxy-2-butanone-4-phosphate synthase [Gammaproteobacteria bacterium]